MGLSAALLALGQPAWAQPPRKATSATPAPAAPQDADQLYEEGRVAAKAGHLDKARDLYLRSWRLRRHWQVAGSLGRIENETGKFRDAAEHLTFFLKEAPKSMDDAVRKAAQEMLDKARAKVGALSITVDRAGAEVLVDGVMVGKSPLEGVLFVEPGPVFVEARLEGYPSVKVSRVVGLGGEERVGLQLVKVPISQDVAPEGGRGGPNKAILIAGGAVGAAAALVGAGFWIGASVKARDSHATEALGAVCGPNNDTSYVTCQSRFMELQQDKVRFENVSKGVFIGSGVVLAGTGIYALVAWATKPKTELKADIAVGRNQAGVVFTAPW